MGWLMGWELFKMEFWSILVNGSVTKDMEKVNKTTNKVEIITKVIM